MKNSLNSPSVTRRQFVAGSLTALGISPVITLAEPQKSPSLVPGQAKTVQEVIDTILKAIPGGSISQTVDTLKAGNGNEPVTGIVSTMFATVEVIRKAVDLKANFIIVHEPTFYSHTDETSWLESDRVYGFKRDLLQKHNIAVWRFHDYWHRHQPDGIRAGVLRDLGWERYIDESNARIVNLPAMPLKQVIAHLKKTLGIKTLRTIGDGAQICKRVLLMPGASGGRSQISLLQKEEPDLLICGEVAEWETSEYIRDARAMGIQRSLIVLGHAQSEEPGMAWLVSWLQPKVPDIPVHHIPSGNPFTFA